MVNRTPGQFLSAKQASEDVVLTLPTTSSSTAYTFSLSDTNGYKQFTSGSATTATIPPNSSVSFPIGSILTIEQNGAGVVTWTAGDGVTINSTGAKVASNGQYAVSSAIKVVVNTWTLFGNLT